MQMKDPPRSGCCGPERPELRGLLTPELFKALAEPNRLAILLELAARGCACTVGELGRCCPRDLSVVSRHLSKLREAGIVRAERHGKEIHYSLARRLPEILRQIADAWDACCPPDQECAPNTCGSKPQTGG